MLGQRALTNGAASQAQVRNPMAVLHDAWVVGARGLPQRASVWRGPRTRRLCPACHLAHCGLRKFLSRLRMQPRVHGLWGPWVTVIPEEQGL